MRICLPTNNSGGLGDHLCEHFGRAPTFTVVDTESDEVTVHQNRSEHMGGTGKPPEQIAKTGAKVLICSGLGPKAIDMLVSFGVEVYVGAYGTVGEAIQQWKEGKLSLADAQNACKEHHH
jgi:predicted Fe-Mo cluster-binding NifX family protein